MQPSPPGDDGSNTRMLRELHFSRQQRQQQRNPQTEQSTPAKASSSRTPARNEDLPSTLVPPGAPRIPYILPVRINQQQSARPQAATSSSSSTAKVRSNTNQAFPLQSTSKRPHPTSSSLPKLSQKTITCYVCWDDLRPREVIGCQSTSEKHYICKSCLKTYAHNELSQQKCVIVCGGNDCKAIIPKKPIVAVLDEKTNQKWDVLVARKTTEMAMKKGFIKGLVQCPFCELQCILPSVREQPLFVCQRGQGGCGKVSCRKCKKEEHPFRKCEEVVDRDAKGKELTVAEKARLELEEAMSEALIQRCNKCHQQFVKEFGCNEIKCSRCGHIQCYVCGTKLFRNDDHYGQVGSGKCQMYDNTAVHETKIVKAAEAKKIKELLKKYPTLKASDLKIKVSKKVKADDKQREKDWVHPELMMEEGYIEGGPNPFTGEFAGQHGHLMGTHGFIPHMAMADEDRRLAEEMATQQFFQEQGWYDQYSQGFAGPSNMGPYWGYY